MKFILGSIIFLLGFQTEAKGVELKKVTTPRGDILDVAVHLPDSTGPSSAVVIGSGGGYHMNLPLIELLAEKLAARGLVAVRFNWSYFSKGEKPSEGLLNEFEDYKTVVGYVKGINQVKKNNIIFAGKSLGTVVAYRNFAADPSALGLLLLTPICTSQYDEEGRELKDPVPVAPFYYPKLLKETRPVALTLGNEDSLCSLPMLYDFLKDSKGNIAVLSFEGNHSLNLGAYDDPTFVDRNNKNIEAATSALSHWARLIVDRASQ